MNSKQICGLLGRKLGHSYSPQIHGILADYSYELFQKEPEDVESFLKHGNWHGINVTIPYKKAVIPFLDELSPTAARLGAVNTVVRTSDRKLIGHNTDYYGFRFMVEKSGLNPRGKKCLVLGSGGASATVVAVLQEMGGDVTVISRSGENNYQNIAQHADASILVNTTPVGMYPDTGISPVDLRVLPGLEGVLDIVYNPARTRLLMDAEELGLTALGGLWMLVAQAKEAAEWFLGTSLQDSLITKGWQSVRNDMENIILIGMPGCGKSTTARLLHDAMPERPIVEIDAEIEKAAGKSIPEIFAQDGEEAFRALETDVLAKFCKGSGQIISTGGGCVTRERNYPILRQNGQLFWLKRDISQLPTDGRPLSQAGKLEEMYRIRKPLYEQFADHTVDSGDIAAIVAIMGGLK